MAFLDKNDRVYDILLTEDGIRALSRGQLNYSYFVVFDDEIDYDPFLPLSSSYSQEQLVEERNKQIEETLLLESPVIKAKSSRIDNEQSLAPRYNLFDAADGFKIIPKFLANPSGSFSIEVQQQTVDDKKYHYYRGKSTQVSISAKLEGDNEQSSISSGFEIEYFSSGSTGLVPFDAKRDKLQRDLFEDQIIIFSDRESGKIRK